MKVIFAGTHDFAVPALQMLIESGHDICAVYTQPDRPSGRGRKCLPSPIKQLALDAGLTVLQPETLKQPEEQQRMAALEPDVLVVVAYGLILPQAILDIPRSGCINIHGSLLPRWRGAAPIHRALMAGDDETGITIMKVVQKLDAGDMLYKLACPIRSDDTSSDLHDKLALMGAEGLKIVLQQIEQGGLKPEVQDESLVTYAHKLEKSEAILDWNQPAVVLDRQIRGLNSWPVAQTTYQGQILRIWRSRLSNQSHQLSPGQVQVDGKQLLVATGDGLLELLEVQLPGGKRIDSQAFLNAHSMDQVVLGL
jgi:methionyl-tRNA formyltransferase